MASGVMSLYVLSKYALCCVISVNVHGGVCWSKFGEICYTPVY